MKKVYLRALTFLLLVFLFYGTCSFLFAGEDMLSRPERFRPHPRKEKMRAIYLWKLIDYLDLSDEQIDTFTPRLKKHQRRVDEKREELSQFYHQLLKQLREGKEFSSEDVKQTLEQVATLQCELASLEREFILNQGDILTPEQQIKFVVFNERFRQQIRKFMEQPD